MKIPDRDDAGFVKMMSEWVDEGFIKIEKFREGFDDDVTGQLKYLVTLHLCNGGILRV